MTAQVVMILAPFQLKTHVMLTSYLKSSTNISIIIKNTENRSLNVNIVKVPSKKRNIILSCLKFDISPRGEAELIITWTPTEIGSWRDIVQLTDHHGKNYYIAINTIVEIPNFRRKTYTVSPNSNIKNDSLSPSDNNSLPAILVEKSEQYMLEKNITKIITTIKQQRFSLHKSDFTTGKNIYTVEVNTTAKEISVANIWVDNYGEKSTNLVQQKQKICKRLMEEKVTNKTKTFSQSTLNSKMPPIVEISPAKTVKLNTSSSKYLTGKRKNHQDSPIISCKRASPFLNPHVAVKNRKIQSTIIQEVKQKRVNDIKVSETGISEDNKRKEMIKNFPSNITTNSIDNNYAFLHRLLNYLKYTIEFIRLSPKNCQEICTRQFVTNIYDIMKKSNRSLPWKNICLYCTIIIITLAKQPNTANYVKNISYMETIARLMKANIKQGTVLFLHLATLIWILTEDRKFAYKIIHCKRTMWLIKSVCKLEINNITKNIDFTTTRKKNVIIIDESLLPDTQPESEIGQKRPQIFTSVEKAVVALMVQLNINLEI